jgi:hypothetical protein
MGSRRDAQNRTRLADHAVATCERADNVVAIYTEVQQPAVPISNGRSREAAN